MTINLQLDGRDVVWLGLAIQTTNKVNGARPNSENKAMVSEGMDNLREKLMLAVDEAVAESKEASENGR